MDTMELSYTEGFGTGAATRAVSQTVAAVYSRSSRATPASLLTFEAIWKSGSS
jgi:hypothetical protein